MKKVCKEIPCVIVVIVHYLFFLNQLLSALFRSLNSMIHLGNYTSTSLYLVTNPSPTGLLVAVALLWGATNPYLKKGSAGVENVKAVNPIQQKIAEIVFLATRFSVIVPDHITIHP